VEATVFDILTEAGPLGVFALYLIWQRQKDALNMDETMARFTERSDKEEALIRERFDAVVDKYDKEREALFRDISSKLDKLLQQPSTAVPIPPSQQPTTESMIERAVTKAMKTEDDS